MSAPSLFCNFSSRVGFAERRVAISLVCWALGLLFLIGLAGPALFRIPASWAILGTIIKFAVFLVGFSHQLSGPFVFAELTNKQFYEFARSQHSLWVAIDGECNLPKLPKVVPMHRLVLLKTKSY